MNIAEFTMNYVKNRYPRSFAKIVEIILSNEEFIIYLLQQKQINQEWPLKDFNSYLDAKENKNFLNFAVKNYKCGTFLDLLNVCHDDLNKVNAKNETLLDHVIENDSKFDNSFIRRILFKLPNDFKVKFCSSVKFSSRLV